MSTEAEVVKIGTVNTSTPVETFEDTIARLATLSETEYEKVRTAEAKAIKTEDGKGIRVGALDKAVEAKRPASESANEPKDIVQMAIDVGITLFHDKMDTAYAEVTVESHVEIWPVESTQFGKWLNRIHWNETKAPLREQTRRDAISTLAGLAEVDGKEHEVFLRVAYADGKNYIDLCDDEWQVIEVDKTGWRVLNRSPVKFRRTSTMEALPMPIQGGDHTKLWKLLNIKKKDRPFVLTLLIDSMRADTQYVVGEFTGGQGSAKSMTQRMIKRLYDPNVVDLRKTPRRDEDVWVATRNLHSISYENASHLSPGLQDTLCIIATGGGNAARKLYSNLDESVVEAKNPILINGIVPVVTASDLSDRTVRIHLPKLDPTKIVEEKKIRAEYEAAQPSILGGLLDVFSGALAVIDSIKLKNKPRMLSYAILGEAISKHLGKNWAFTDNYLSMRQGLLIEAAQGSPAAMAIVSMMQKKKGFHGTFQQLLELLDGDYRPGYTGDAWPKTSRGLSAILARFAPGLAAMGIGITNEGHSREGNKVKIEVVKKTPNSD